MAHKTRRGTKPFTTKEINAGFDAAKASMRRGKEAENFEQLWSDEMQAAWKALSPEKRIDVLDMIVGMGVYIDERCLKHFPTLAKTDDIADFGKIGRDNACANFRDSVLVASFDFAANTFTVQEFRKTMTKREAQLRHFEHL